VYWKFLKEFYY